VIPSFELNKMSLMENGTNPRSSRLTSNRSCVYHVLITFTLKVATPRRHSTVNLLPVAVKNTEGNYPTGSIQLSVVPPRTSPSVFHGSRPGLAPMPRPLKDAQQRGLSCSLPFPQTPRVFQAALLLIRFVPPCLLPDSQCHRKGSRRLS
jgi:hypothetical protein